MMADLIRLNDEPLPPNPLPVSKKELVLLISIMLGVIAGILYVAIGASAGMMAMGGYDCGFWPWEDCVKVSK